MDVILGDGLDELAGRTVRVRCADCDSVLGALQSNGAAFGLRPVDEIERSGRVLANTGFHARPARAHVGQQVYRHSDGSTTVTWVHRCATHRRPERSIARRLDRLALAWVNAARANVDLRVEG